MNARRDTSWATAAPAYAELQAMSNFSFLTGASHPHELIAQAKALGLTAIAITDRNTLAGIVRAHVAAKAAGIRLVVGVRLDLEDAPSLLCYPTDRDAYGRLCRLLSLGQMRSPKGQCRLTIDDVGRHAEGQLFIALPPDSWTWREAVVEAGTNAFERALSCLAAKLGRTRLHLAATHLHQGDDRARLAGLASLARRTKLSLVATGDVRFHAPHRRPLADVLACIREGITLADAGTRLAKNAERHLKSPREMARLLRGHERALARTIDIVSACRFSLDELRYEYPDEPIPAGTTAQLHLETLARAGAGERFPDGVPEKVGALLERELTLIAELDYAPYFLTVHDIVAFARSRSILAQGRGSAANSVVCYCLGITAVDPTEIDLLFERFISAERREPPDIDVDFEHERREEVIQYIYQRYGRERAGLAATVISYRARSAVREVGRAMGLSEDTVAALAGMVWGTHSDGVLPERHVREAGLDPGDPLLAAVLDLAGELTGFPRHLSQHVGGFVLARRALVEIVPVGNAAMPDRTFIEWDKDDLAALGLMKVDVLALGMLSCIRRAFALLAQHRGLELTLARIPRQDDAVYDMLCQADSIGVFQVESRAQMNMLPRLRPRTFYDLVIEVAIVRPGPIQGDMVHPYLRRRSGLEPEIYPSPAPGKGDKDELRQILGKTKGVPLFQEQAMRIAMVAAQFSDGEVNELRKAMATFRRRGTIGQLEDKMISAMVARGYEPAFAARCFNQIKGFGEYGFPESHAASFALLVYVSAWLKCHHPAAFAAGLLNAQPMGFYAPAQIVRDAREHGVEVRPVDVNASDWDATLEPDAADGGLALRLGLRQIEGLAHAEAEKIVRARAGPVAAVEERAPVPRQPFRDTVDLLQRARLRSDTLERLAAADAMRSLGLDRRQALWTVKGLVVAPSLPLFAWGAASESRDEPHVVLPTLPLSEHVVNDYQTLRLSLKAHPMHFLRADLKAERILACSDLQGLKDGARVAVAGVILVRQRPGSAKGVVFMTIEDETGIANVVVWSKTLERYRRVVMGARLVLVRGRIQRHESIIHLVSERLEDRSAWLARLIEDDDGTPMPIPIANADEVLRPEPGSARSRAIPSRPPPENIAAASVPAQPIPRVATKPAHTPHQATATHPRLARVMPRSRDFH
ncbi:MAG: error-prone DNA polymerase [Hyphomicrobiaceae bacterium]